MKLFSRLFTTRVPELKEPAPCGDDATHAYWRSINWPCPLCYGAAEDAAKEARAQREAERLARAIADEFEARGLR